MAQKTFIFDFDSTLFPGESLDEIIQLQLESETNSEQKKKEITRICNLGMRGEISMEQSLKQRLDIGAPSKETIAQYIGKNRSRIESSIIGLLAHLQKEGNLVLVISGGFEEWIKPLLDSIVPAENIYANQIKDNSLPMYFENIIRKDKESIINDLKSRIADSPVIMVGDGATDFSVFQNGLAQHFIGAFYYTGIQARKHIVQLAEENNQPTFETLEAFINHLKELI